MNTTTLPQRRRSMAYAVASQLENDQLLAEDLHAEIATRSMGPLAPPVIMEDLDDYDSDLVKENLAMSDRISIDREDFVRMQDALTELLEGSTGYDQTGTLGEGLHDVRSAQCDYDEDPDEKTFTVTPAQFDKIQSDLATKLEAIQKMVDALDSSQD